MAVNKIDNKLANAHKSNGLRSLTKKSQKPKNIFTTPYELKWPLLIDKDELYIQERLTSTLSSLNIGRVKGHLQEEELSGLSREEKNEKRKSLRKEYWKKSSDFRSHFVFGISQAIRSLEKDQLLLVLVSKDVTPTLLIEPLLLLCCSRNVYASAINGLGTLTKNCLHFNSCAVLGIKRTVAALDADHPVYQLLSDIKRKLPPLPDLLDMSVYSLPAECECRTSRTSVCPPADKDFSHLYIRKNQVQPLQSKSDDFLSFSASTDIAMPKRAKEITYNSRKRYHELKMKKVNPKKMKTL